MVGNFDFDETPVVQLELELGLLDLDLDLRLVKTCLACKASRKNRRTTKLRTYLRSKWYFFNVKFLCMVNYFEIFWVLFFFHLCSKIGITKHFALSGIYITMCLSKQWNLVCIGLLWCLYWSSVLDRGLYYAIQRDIYLYFSRLLLQQKRLIT